jgi:hypothetical protein
MGSITADDGVFAAITAAQVAVNYADFWAPTTVAISKIMGDGTGGPFSIGEAAGKWYDGASKLQEAQSAFTELTSSLPRDYWDGDDRSNFDAEVKNLAAEIGDSHNYAMAVAITLTTLAVPLGIFPVVCDGIGIAEFALATAFYLAAASGIGDITGVSEELFAMGEEFSFAALEVMQASMDVLLAMMAAGTAAVLVSDATDLNTQEGHGDTGIRAEFGKASVDSAADVAAALALDKLAHREGGEGGDPAIDVLKERAQEKAREKITEPATAGLSSLINEGIGHWSTGWNEPDAPKPSDESWGAGE